MSSNDNLRRLNSQEDAFMEALMGGLPVLSAAQSAGFRFASETEVLADPRMRMIIQAMITKLFAFVQAAPAGDSVHGAHVAPQWQRS